MLIHGPWIVYCGLIFWLSNQPSLPGTPGRQNGSLIAYFIWALFFAGVRIVFRWERRALDGGADRLTV